MTEVVEDTKGKIRDKPIAAKLKRLLEVAGEAAGVDTVLVTSGGQPSKKEGGKRTGSDRHDHGNAADLKLIKDGKALSFNTNAGLKVFSTFVTAAAANGATGIGAGIAYMGAYTIHVGYGSRAIWGAGGKAANAPAWLVAAVNKGWNNPVTIAALSDADDYDETVEEPESGEEAIV